MAVLKSYTAYFDASGTPDDKAARGLFVGGFVATVHKWERLDAEWPALLARYGLRSPLHRTDFEAFVAPRSDAALGLGFRVDALRLLNKYTNKAIGVGVIVPAFRRLFREFEVPGDVQRDPYVWCGTRVMTDLSQWAKNRLEAGTLSRNRPCNVFFEHGDGARRQERLRSVVEERTHITIAFLPKGDTVPFQACDFLAWQYRKFLDDRDAGVYVPRDELYEVQRLYRQAALFYADWRVLERSAIEQGFPRRASR